MGKKRRMIAKPNKFGRKFVNHPATTTVETPAPVVVPTIPVPVVEKVSPKPAIKPVTKKIEVPKPKATVVKKKKTTKPKA
jgi:hypothetical protein|tara:strand:+ start:381 stop:620 length:240 start_codon:yes stop_codon:yes gene_type:complete